MKKEQLLNEVLDEIKEEILSCGTIRQDKKHCLETTCETYFICRELFKLEHDDLEGGA